MRNLYNVTATVGEMRRVFGSFEGDTTNLPPFDEIFPGHLAPVLRRTENGGLTLDRMKWGFPGLRAAGSCAVTNVRNLSSPFWRNALQQPERRCIVPVTSFCKWTGEVGRKQKVWFELTKEHESPLFAFAGLWRPGEGGPFMAFLTCEANAIVAEVHPKAMPVMLCPADVSMWLDRLARKRLCASRGFRGYFDAACGLSRPKEIARNGEEGERKGCPRNGQVGSEGQIKWRVGRRIALVEPERPGRCVDQATSKPSGH